MGCKGRMYENMDVKAIKDIEAVTNHDVKAVEYFLKEKLQELNITHALEYIHFGLTSQDINNTAIPLLFKHALENEYYPALQKLTDALDAILAGKTVSVNFDVAEDAFALAGHVAADGQLLEDAADHFAG